MDLDGNYDEDLSVIYGELEDKDDVFLLSNPPQRSSVYLFAVTAGLGGLQCIFSLIFSNGSIYLSGLGISKPILSLVWITGPLAGMTLQPYFGLRSDECLSSWGRRRPYIVFGATASIVSLLGLAMAGRASQTLAGNAQTVEACMAVTFIILLNIAIQPLQGAMRALLVDMCSRDEQPAANVIAGIVINTASVFSYATGLVDFSSINFFQTIGGDSQFAVLCILTSLVLAISVLITCLVVREKRYDAPHKIRRLDYSPARVGSFRYLYRRLYCLPNQVRKVFKVQFFSWMGWFPFLFYVTSYIGRKYVATLTENEIQSHKAPGSLQIQSARAGSSGMLLFATAALIAGALLTFAHRYEQHPLRSANPPPCSGWAITVRGIWICSQILYAGCMLATFFVASLEGIYLLVGTCGISWAVTIWAPYTIINSQILLKENRDSATLVSEELLNALETEKIDSEDIESMGTERGPGSETRPGLVLGLHNVAIAGPQIIAAIFCSAIFWAVQGTSQDGTLWVLRFGGLSSCVAAFLARGIQPGDAI
ncbi:hypothetical protein VTL71DRAFT_6839 [Oculimacula yallundae]|uniref:Sucrose transporter n=1 Tax=Oculimacula yallundae TaxID=86028 RepID=A0ABR4BUY6_9HELO